MSFNCDKCKELYSYHVGYEACIESGDFCDSCTNKMINMLRIIDEHSENTFAGKSTPGWNIVYEDKE